MEQRIDYIFCITTGRSGSEYLKTLFSLVSGCQAFHEADPVGNGDTMRRYLDGDPEPIRSLVQQKVELIKQIKRQCRIYVETNHCFIKGFGWFIPQYLPEDRIGVIVLSRTPSEIAESTLGIGCSPLTPFGRDWIITPSIKNPLIRPPKRLFSPRTSYSLFRFLKWLCRGERFNRAGSRILDWLTIYELECLKWYVDETAAQARAFQKRFKRIKYYEVNIENLNTLDEVNKMFDYFGCTAKESLISVIGKPTNLKRNPQ